MNIFDLYCNIIIIFLVGIETYYLLINFTNDSYYSSIQTTSPKLFEFLETTKLRYLYYFLSLVLY